MAAFILRGRSQAALFIFATGILSLIIPPVVLFSGAAVALVTLRNSFQTTLSVLLIAFAFASVFLWIITAKPQLVLAMLMVWLPVLLVATILRLTSNLALSILTSIALGLGVIATIYFFIPEPSLIWLQVLQEWMALLSEASNPEQTLVTVELLAKVMTGVLTAGLLLNCNICLLIGRWWQSSLYKPGAFAQEFYSLRLGKQFTILAMVLYGLYAYLDKEWLLAGLLVVCSAYLFQGLSVIHAFASRKSNMMLWLIGFYLLVIFFQPLLLFIVLFGIIDAWFDSRKRWSIS